MLSNSDENPEQSDDVSGQQDDVSGPGDDLLFQADDNSGHADDISAHSDDGGIPEQGIDNIADVNCDTSCNPKCCGTTSCGGTILDHCWGEGTCNLSSCECRTSNGWVEKTANGDFSSQANCWPVSPAENHNEGTVEVINSELVLKQTGDGIVVNQMIDLTGSPYTQYSFSALVDPVQIVDPDAPGIGILLDSFKTPEMNQNEKVFLGQQIRATSRQVVKIDGNINPSYPVFNLWILVSAGVGAQGKFDNVSFKVQ